jgi:hypothetical protein
MRDQLPHCLTLTYEAAEVFHSAQIKQDLGHAWRIALSAAEFTYARLTND